MLPDLASRANAAISQGSRRVIHDSKQMACAITPNGYVWQHHHQLHSRVSFRRLTCQLQVLYMAPCRRIMATPAASSNHKPSVATTYIAARYDTLYTLHASYSRPGAPGYAFTGRGRLTSSWAVSPAARLSRCVKHDRNLNEVVYYAQEPLLDELICIPSLMPWTMASSVVQRTARGSGSVKPCAQAGMPYNGLR